LEYFGWLKWPGCLAVSFENLYNGILAFKSGKLGNTARAIAEFLGFSFSEANLPDLLSRIYGHGRPIRARKTGERRSTRSSNGRTATHRPGTSPGQGPSEIRKIMSTLRRRVAWNLRRFRQGRGTAPEWRIG
jgi:hypothetical protein